MPKVTQPGVAESGLHPGPHDFRTQVCSHYTPLPLEKLQADEERPRKRRIKQSRNAIAQNAHDWSGVFS